MRLHGSLERRLTETREEIARLREALRVLDEQVAFQRDVAAEAVTRAVVASTPLADRDRREAERDLHRLERERDDTSARVAALAEEQDHLLDRLFTGLGPPEGRGAP